MNAVPFRTSPGLIYEEVPDPRPDADQVLGRLANTGFCGSDHLLVGLLPDGCILGHEISAVVADRGSQAGGPPTGTRVCICPTWCGRCPNCLEGKPPLPGPPPDDRHRRSASRLHRKREGLSPDALTLGDQTIPHIKEILINHLSRRGNPVCFRIQGDPFSP